MKILPLFGCAILIELGWLAIWPLSGALSHSPRFTITLLEMHPLVRQSFDFTLQAAHGVLPGLPDSPMTDRLGSASYQVPATALAAEVRSGDTVTIGPYEVVTDDLYVFGNNLVIEGTVNSASAVVRSTSARWAGESSG